MPLPTGVVTCALTFGVDTDFGGNPVSVEVTVTPSTDLVWKATGQRIVGKNFPQVATASAGFPGSISMPVVDQGGMADGQGNDITSWFYTVTAVYRDSAGRSETVTKNWSPVTGQTTVDFDLITSGPALPVLLAPTAPVTSVAGFTGVVTLAQLQSLGLGGGGADTGAVHYTADTPTLTQRQQAQTNIGVRRPWQFRPEDYGAKGDAQIARDVATNSTNTITSATIAAAATVGQWVLINGGRGNADTAAIGTITAISGNNITLDTTARSLPVNFTGTSLDAVWFTDDTAAIINAFTAGKAYAESHNYYFEVVFQDKGYGVAGLTQSNDGNIMYNTQIPIPRPTSNNARKLVIGVKGAGRVAHHDYWNSTTTDFAGTTIVTSQTAPGTMDATYLFQSVFGAGIPQSGGNMAGTMTPVFVNHKPVFENISILAPVYTNITGFDFQYSSGAYSDGCQMLAFAQALYGTGVHLMDQYATGIFGGKLGCGMRLPITGNNADVVVPEWECTGIAVALATPSEHVTIGTLKTFFNGVVLQITASSTGHGLTIQRVTAEAYQGGIRNELTAGGNKVPIFVGMWNTETSAASGGYDVSDSGNSLTGQINWANTVDSAHLQPVVVGAGNVRIVNVGTYRGAQTAPAVPASTVALLNPFWRDATVRITGGTVTSVVVDGQTVATATNATVTVPTGKSITLTYSAAPTWTWNTL